MFPSLVRTLRAVGLLVVLLVLAGCARSGSTAPVEVVPSPTGALRGLVMSTTFHLPHVSLLDTSGRAFDPAAYDDHAVTLLFTGYTHCQDVCPTTMADIATALRDLPASVARQVQVEFVSTDPYRDSGPVIRQWLDRFNPSFVGLHGTLAQVALLSGQLGLPLPEDAGTTHSSEVLAFVRGHGANVAWISGFTPADLVHDLPVLVAQAA